MIYILCVDWEERDHVFIFCVHTLIFSDSVERRGTGDGEESGDREEKRERERRDRKERGMEMRVERERQRRESVRGESNGYLI